MKTSKFQKLLGMTALVLSGSLSAAPLVLLGSADNNNAGVTALATAATGDLYVRFDLGFTGTVSSNDFAALWFDNVATGDHTNRANFGLKANSGPSSSPGSDYFARTSGTGGVFDTTPSFQVANGSSVNLFAHLYKTGSSTNYDRLDLWIGSTLSSLDLLSTAADVSASGNTGISSVSYLGFRNANLSAFNSTDQVTISNFSVTSAVPEPSTWALMAMSLMGMAVVMRRRKS